ncbi:putative PB1 domain-containing protein [Helianthus anomalus]
MIYLILDNQYIIHVFQLNYNPLQAENLATKPMAKVIKVQYNNEIIKFSLPLMSGITDLWAEVTRRFKKVNQNAFRIKYIDSNRNSFHILSDDGLWECIANASSNGMMPIKMIIERAT